MARGRETYRDPVARWSGVGPYYAMFPVDFADKVIAEHTDDGDVVLDPFSGRGTAVFSAAAQGRVGLGVELNPVGWIYSKAKLQPAAQSSVLARLAAVQASRDEYADEARRLPVFFHRAYSREVRRFLCAARSILLWKTRKVDWTLMAFILVYLHGKRSAALSNQMRQTKAMSPDYSVRWWKEKGLEPPDIDPVAFLTQRINWRYAYGMPDLSPTSQVYLGDSTTRLASVKPPMPVKLLFTSPPYCGVTNYHYDQWIRLWMLGGEPNALRVRERHRGKFEGRAKYKGMLTSVFTRAAKMMADDGVVYIRTDQRSFTKKTTLDVLGTAFHGWTMEVQDRPYGGGTQTALFRQASGSGEVDIVLRRA